MELMPCPACSGLQYCETCGSLCGYLRRLPAPPCASCTGISCRCLPALRFPLLTDWFWIGGRDEPHQTQVHGVVHYPPGAAVPRNLLNHGTISTSMIRQVLSVQHGLVRSFSGTIYQLHPHSRQRDCLALAQRPLVAAYDLLYLHALLEQGRASLRSDALLAPWWRLPSALFAVVLQHLLPYVRTT